MVNRVQLPLVCKPAFQTKGNDACVCVWSRHSVQWPSTVTPFDHLLRANNYANDFPSLAPVLVRYDTPTAFAVEVLCTHQVGHLSLFVCLLLSSSARLQVSHSSNALSLCSGQWRGSRQERQRISDTFDCVCCRNCKSHSRAAIGVAPKNGYTI